MPSVRHCSLSRLESGMATVPRLFELSNSLIGRSGVFKGLHPNGLSPANHGFLRPSSDSPTPLFRVFDGTCRGVVEFSRLVELSMFCRGHRATLICEFQNHSYQISPRIRSLLKKTRVFNRPRRLCPCSPCGQCGPRRHLGGVASAAVPQILLLFRGS